jgi:hypothetical protein
LECGLVPEEELASINEQLVETGFESLSDLREAAAHARHKYPDLVGDNSRFVAKGASRNVLISNVGA